MSELDRGEPKLSLLSPQVAGHNAEEESSLVEVAIVQVVLRLEGLLGSKYKEGSIIPN